MSEPQEGSLLLTTFDNDRLAFLLSAVDAKGLGRLACTAKRFTTKTFSAPEPHGEQWTLIEEAARIRVSSYPDAVRQLVAPRQDGEAWLRVAAALAPMATPLLFNLPLAEDPTTLTRHCSVDYGTEQATCEQPAASGVGRQYVEFTAVQLPTVPLHPTLDLNSPFPYSLETGITVAGAPVDRRRPLALLLDVPPPRMV